MVAYDLYTAGMRIGYSLQVDGFVYQYFRLIPGEDLLSASPGMVEAMVKRDDRIAYDLLVDKVHDNIADRKK
jgi:hypothetical protein